MSWLQFVVLLCFAASSACCAGAQNSGGGQPTMTFGARDVFEEYNLPLLRDQPVDALWREEQHTQLLTRAKALNLDTHAATDSWMKAAQIFSHAKADAYATETLTPIDFSGRKASELNTLLALPATHFVRVMASSIELDEAIVISGKNVRLDLGTAHLSMQHPVAYMIRIENADKVTLTGGFCTGKAWGVLVSRSSNTVVRGVVIDHASGGILVTDSEEVTLWGNTFHALEAAPILLHGTTRHGVVAENDIMGNLGGSNWHAGIVISDRNADLASDPRQLLRDDNYGVREQPIVSRQAIPMDNVIAFNHIVGNLSSGVYSDGGSRNTYVQNTIQGNSKEGFCLDNGSTSNVVIFNTIEDNGKRWGKRDNDLQRDFVLNLGRLPDGSSPAKLPGISLDNTAYNQVMFNSIDGNFGGGIKMVRTAFYNIIGMNTLNENNEGRSTLFHFFGIELGAASADVKVPDLDFTAARGNEIFGNNIRGKHYAGIFFASGANRNIIFDNSIFGATSWGMESVELQQNESFNNLSNLRCRNVSTGLDPHLLATGKGS